MSTVRLDASWAKFGNCREFALVGRDAIATASGIYARFYDRRSGRTRVERFDGGERGDGADCIAGHSVAPVFSVVERRANPRISIFAYPTTRRIARCADSRRASGYLCCAFAGTEYLLGQTAFPDFRLVVWHWRTGERLTEIGWPAAAAALNVAVEGSRIACSVDFSRLIARHAAPSTTLSVYRLLACSGTAILLPVETRFDRRPVSCSWSLDGALLCCDEAGTAWSVDFDETEDRRARTVVERSAVLGGRPLLVAHDGGAVIVDRPSATSSGDARATLYRKSSGDRDDKWSAAWTTSLPCRPRQVESDPRETRIFVLGENGDLYEMSGPSADDPPRLELLQRGGEPSCAAIFPLSESHFAALDRDDRLAIVDASTGSRVSTKLLGHHGKVAGAASHPAMPILASCSRTGACLLVEATEPSRPRIARCVHLQREAVDRAKFSRGGRLLGVAASQAGRLFVLSLGVSVSVSVGGSTLNAKVAAWMNVRRRVVDFVVRETDDSGTARAVVLLGAGAEADPRMGNEIAVYSCRLSGDYRETRMDRTARLPSALGGLDEGREDGRGDEMIGVARGAKQLHRIALQEESGEARLVEVLPSLHQIGGIGITVDHGTSSLLTHGFDGLIVWRERDEPRRVASVFVAHHRAEGGARAAILVADAIVSLGRNGDLVGNRLIGRRIPERPEAVDFPVSGDSSEAGTWMDAADRQLALAESGAAPASGRPILEEWDELKRMVQALLDSNEKEPSRARLPVSVFDLDREGRQRRTLAARAKEIAWARESELRIAFQDEASSYLRQRFSDPFVVRPRSVRSFFASSKVANYPLTKLEPRGVDYRDWSRFSVATRAMVSRSEGEESARAIEAENRPWAGSRRGFLEMLEASAVAEDSERESKARFNERFEEVRSAKRSAIRVATARAAEARRLVDELKRTFRVDAASSLLEAARTWDHPAEESQKDDDDRDDFREDFRREALGRMMDGVLEVGLETSAKRSIPRPGCLLRKDASAYTEDDVREVEAYERRIREREADRRKYRSMLEAEIERIEGDFSRDTGAFDEALAELSTEKLRVERSILAHRLSRTQELLRHRAIVRGRREIRRAIETGLEPAVQEGRLLDERSELLEAAVAELRTRYETARRRDKLLEVKFRADLSELRPSTMETLFRHYRRRPRARWATEATSVAFLSELAVCVLRKGSPSDALPPEYSDYLRALEQLDAMPDSLSSRSEPGPEPEQWRTACRLRRLKLEAEIKVRIRAIELAEAERSLACLRTARIAARAAIARRREAVERLERAVADGPGNNREIALPLKAAQLFVRVEGWPRSDCEDAVLIPRSEIGRATQAIRQAEAERSLARRKLADARRVVSAQECRHARAAAAMADLRERAEDIERLKVSRIVRACCEASEAGAPRAEDADRADKLVAPERGGRRKRIATETRAWRRRNAESDEAVARSEAERDQLVAATRDPLRARVVAFRVRRMGTRRREARLARRTRRVSSELSILRSRLELSKLRTYPTLTLEFR